MSLLPNDFHFSQASLQDYVDCRRRFQLRYLEKVTWPAVEAEPALENERRLQLGAKFHHLVQQHVIGLPAERLSTMALAGEREGDELKRWWGNYLQHGADLAGYRAIPGVALHPEISLSATVLDRYRLVAKYDLIAVAADGRAAIFDWKTFRNRPERGQMAERMQTHIYPYVLTLACAHLNQGVRLQPDQVEMIYWYPEFPTQPERFAYSLEQFEEDGETLHDMIAEIENLRQDAYTLTNEIKHCRYCIYRSLCDRGVEAGDLEALEVREETRGELGADVNIDFDQIAEIEF